MFGLTFVTPWLLAGAALIAAPIIIHLLSKRKFKIIGWAAMEFLLEADRRNRRRVRLESLLLLLLRCLAIILLALLVARPLINPTGLLGAAAPNAAIQRVIILDDSPSMTAVVENRSAFEAANAGLVEFVRDLARQRPGDTLTLITTSAPDRPVFNGQPLGAAQIDQLIEQIERLEPTDLSGNPATALQSVERLMGDRSGPRNHVIYMITDLRDNEWGVASPAASSASAEADDSRGPDGAAGATGAIGADGPDGATSDAAASPNSPGPLLALVRQIADRAAGFFIIDVGGEVGANLSVTQIAPLEKSLAAGVESRFEVTIANTGNDDAQNVDVSFKPLDAPEIRTRLPLVRAGESASVPFTYVFRQIGAVGIEVSVGADALVADNTRHFAGEVRQGTQILLVDGDPSTQPGRGETYFLQHALAPPGELPSGNVVDITTEGQFEGLTLDRYQAIIICNLYRLSEERITALENWVRGGGGLVFFLGDQVDAAAYNETLFVAGAGLLPAELTEIQGDDEQREWVGLALAAENHPALRVFGGDQNPFIKEIKFFRWWGSKPGDVVVGTAGDAAVVDAAAVGATAPAATATDAAATDAAVGNDAAGEKQIAGTSVVARFTDLETSPAIVEKVFGGGRVMLFTMPADGTWNNWPSDPSFVVAALEVAGYVARPLASESTLAVGQPIEQTLDPSKYSLNVSVSNPAGELTSFAATPTSDGKSLSARFEETGRRGLYRLSLQQHAGEGVEMFYAANIDPAESDLRRAEAEVVTQKLGESRVQILRGKASLEQAALTTGFEIWRSVLIALAVVLGVEQFLAWSFGRNR